MKMNNIRMYSQLKKLSTFKERFDYLKLSGNKVGEDTFGFDRYLNQKFYKTTEWKDLRNYVINRDLGCDLGIDGYQLNGGIVIHHMNPICPNDLYEKTKFLLDPEYLICCSHKTHMAIHYGGFIEDLNEIVERAPNDQCPWK